MRVIGTEGINAGVVGDLPDGATDADLSAAGYARLDADSGGDEGAQADDAPKPKRAPAKRAAAKK